MLRNYEVERTNRSESSKGLHPESLAKNDRRPTKSKLNGEWLNICGVIYHRQEKYENSKSNLSLKSYLKISLSKLKSSFD